MVSMSSAKPESRALPKRFYVQVAFDPVDCGYCITLDGKPVRTPAKQLLKVTSTEIAAAIAAEWDAQIDVIDTDTMPLTRLAHIALDLVPQARADLLADVLRYAETDLLCYRVPLESSADSLTSAIAREGEVRRGMRDLRIQQDATFDPILAWMAQEYGAAFLVTEGLIPVAQPEASLARIAAAFAAAEHHELAALAMLVPLLGSALFALAIWKQKIDVEAALIAARLDETFQAEQWGQDPHAALAWETKARDIRACAFFLTAK